MSKPRRLFPGDSPEPVGCSALALIPLVFVPSPPHQPSVQTAEHGVECRLVVLPVVVDPPSDHPIEYPGEILEALVALTMYLPVADLRHEALGRLAADAWEEAHEESAVTVRRRPGAKSEPQKVETDVRELIAPVVIQAVDDLRLVLLMPTGPARQGQQRV